MSMSDAYTRCEELGIDTTVPDALGRLWEALTPAERPEIFPFARNYDSPTFTAAKAGPGGYVLTEPSAKQWRMWNGTSTLVFQVLHARARGEYKIRYTSGEEGFSTWRELHESSHEVLPPAENTPSGPVPLLEVIGATPSAARPLFPPTEDARRARELAAEHIRRARKRMTPDVPSGGRPWRPGDETRTRVLNEAADTLARLCAVYLGAREGSPRNRDEAHAYALAFRLVSASARRLAHRRIG